MIFTHFLQTGATVQFSDETYYFSLLDFDFDEQSFMVDIYVGF